MITDEDIIKKCYVKCKNGFEKISGHAIKKLSNDELTYLENRFNDSSSINETIQRIYYKIEEKPKCPICGKPVLWLGKHYRLLLKTCSLKCGFKLRQKHNEEHWMKLEGVNNVFATRDCVNKIKQTKLEKYGDENYNNNEKTVKTCLEKYGVKNGGGSKEAVDKIRKTQTEKYGRWYFGSEQQIKQSKATKLLRYGDENYVNIEKCKQTCLKHFNKNTYLHSEEYEKHYKEYNEKRKQTLKKKNKLCQSKAEAFIYNLFTHYFKEIICQYTSDKYPFNCDFYIPEIDTYIEYQGYYTHGKHPFNSENADDLNEVKILEEKNLNHKKPNDNLYYIKLKTWTESDVNKRNIAKMNKINYIEFWNYIEVLKWLESNYEKIN